MEFPRNNASGRSRVSAAGAGRLSGVQATAVAALVAAGAGHAAGAADADAGVAEESGADVVAGQMGGGVSRCSRAAH